MLSQKLVTKCRGSFFGDTFYSIYTFITRSTIRNRGHSHWSFVSLFRHEQGEREPRETAFERYKANTRFKHCCIRGSSVASLSSRAARKSRDHDCREYRYFGRVPWFLAIAVILRHGRDYQRIMYKISTFGAYLTSILASQLTAVCNARAETEIITRHDFYRLTSFFSHFSWHSVPFTVDVAWLASHITFTGVVKCRDFTVIFFQFSKELPWFCTFLPWFSYCEWVENATTMERSRSPAVGHSEPRRLRYNNKNEHSEFTIKIYTTERQCLFQAPFKGRENPSPPKKSYNSPTATKLCAVNLFRLGQWITYISRKHSFNGQ